jgi:hypothetical protein
VALQFRAESRVATVNQTNKPVSDITARRLRTTFVADPSKVFRELNQFVVVFFQPFFTLVPSEKTKRS